MAERGRRRGWEEGAVKKWKMYSPSFPLVLFLGSIPCLLVLSIAETQLSALIHLNRSERGERGGRGGREGKSILAVTLVTCITSRQNNTSARRRRARRWLSRNFHRFSPAAVFIPAQRPRRGELLLKWLNINDDPPPSCKTSCSLSFPPLLLFPRSSLFRDPVGRFAVEDGILHSIERTKTKSTRVERTKEEKLLPFLFLLQLSVRYVLISSLNCAPRLEFAKSRLDSRAILAFQLLHLNGIL